MANVRRFTARTRGPAFSALARTPPAPNCSARCLEDWPRHCRCVAGLSAGRRAVFDRRRRRPRRPLQIIADCTGRTVVSSAFNELERARRGDPWRPVASRCWPRRPAGADPLSAAPSGACATRRCIPFTAVARADAAGMAGQTGRPFNLFLQGPTTMKIVFTAEHAGDLSAFHQLGRAAGGGVGAGQTETQRRSAGLSWLARRRGAGDQLR